MKRAIKHSTTIPYYVAAILILLISCGPKNRSEHQGGGIPDRSDSNNIDSVTRGRIDTTRTDSVIMRDSIRK